jgi:ribosomal protein S19
MLFIKKNLIKLYLNKKKKYIYTTLKSNTITRELIGKSFIIYNGKKWLKKDIDNLYYLNKSIGSLTNLDTKKISQYKSKKKKKKKKKIKI